MQISEIWSGVMNGERTCFVIMPFSSTKTLSEARWTAVFEHVFTPAVEACGYKCQRSVPKTGLMTRSIIQTLRTSYLVLADLTDRNPNVFYELGVRHSFCDRTIVVTQDAKHITADLAGYWYLTYGTEPAEVAKFREQIRERIEHIQVHPDEPDNPVSDYLRNAGLPANRFRNVDNLKKLSALLTELDGNIKAFHIASARISQGSETQSPITLDDYPHELRSECLGLFLTNYYIDPGPEVRAKAYELRDIIDKANMTPLTVPTVADAHRQSIEFKAIVEELYGKIHRGEFAEPGQPSNMAWVSQVESSSGKDATPESFPSSEISTSNLGWAIAPGAVTRPECPQEPEGQRVPSAGRKCVNVILRL